MPVERYYTVRDRVMRAIENELKTITYDNGYNTNVRKVSRTRTVPTNHDSPPQIYLMPDTSTVLWRSTHYKFERIPIDIWFVAQAENGEDTEFNLFLGDIQRVFKCGLVVDTTHPQSDWACIYVNENGSTPLYTQFNAGLMTGVVRYTFEFWRSLTDPRLWDEGDQLVPILQ